MRDDAPLFASLYTDEDVTAQLAFDLDRENRFHIAWEGVAGRYYVRIYTDSRFNTTSPYTLRVTYP